jgi:hypothetical protein
MFRFAEVGDVKRGGLSNSGRNGGDNFYEREDPTGGQRTAARLRTGGGEAAQRRRQGCAPAAARLCIGGGEAAHRRRREDAAGD